MSTPQKKKKPSKTKDAEPVLTTHVEETVKESATIEKNSEEELQIELDNIKSALQEIKGRQDEMDKDVDEVWESQNNVEDKLDLIATVINEKESSPTTAKPELLPAKKMSLLPKVGIAAAIGSTILIAIVLIARRKK